MAGREMFLFLAACFGVSLASYIEMDIPILSYPLQLEACDEECGPGGLCSPTYNKEVKRTYCATCGEGYVATGDSCTKLEECPEECGSGGMCLKYKGINHTECTTCGDGLSLSIYNECVKKIPCDEQCGPGGMCIPSEEHGNVCDGCPSGYRQSLFDYKRCTKVETCEAECGGGECLKEDGEVMVDHWKVACLNCGEGYARPEISGFHCAKLETCDEECGAGGNCTRDAEGKARCLSCGKDMELRYDYEEGRDVCKLSCANHCYPGSKCKKEEDGRVVCFGFDPSTVRCAEDEFQTPAGGCVKPEKCDDICGVGGMCMDSETECRINNNLCLPSKAKGKGKTQHFCMECGEGYKMLSSRRECKKLETCDKECGTGGQCIRYVNVFDGITYPMWECVTCGEGKMMPPVGRKNRCRNLTACDDLCGPGGKCFENGVYCAQCGEGYERKEGPWSRQNGDGGCQPKAAGGNEENEGETKEESKDEAEAVKEEEGADAAKEENKEITDHAANAGNEGEEEYTKAAGEAASDAAGEAATEAASDAVSEAATEGASDAVSEAATEATAPEAVTEAAATDAAKAEAKARRMRRMRRLRRMRRN